MCLFSKELVIGSTAGLISTRKVSLLNVASVSASDTRMLLDWLPCFNSFIETSLYHQYDDGRCTVNIKTLVFLLMVSLRLNFIWLYRIFKEITSSNLFLKIANNWYSWYSKTVVYFEFPSFVPALFLHSVAPSVGPNRCLCLASCYFCHAAHANHGVSSIASFIWIMHVYAFYWNKHDYFIKGQFFLYYT